MAPKSKAEKRYLEKIQNYADLIEMASPDSPMEGFEYFETEEYRDKPGNGGSVVKSMLFSNGPVHFLKLIKIMSKYIRPMMRGREECFTDLKGYFSELEEGLGLEIENRLKETYPNAHIWKELQDYCRTKWNAEIGFTELDNKEIFKGKGVLFRHTLIVIQEMKEDKINQAPGLEAGAEVQRVYNSLGHAVNDIARWLRKKYGIKCQSNHPLGGLVNTPPLAGKAGMGWQGMDGLLITPQFGKRVRIAPIFIQEKIFEYTDHNDHEWIGDFCKNCGKCMRNCPTGAVSGRTDGATRINREKCFPQFCKTLGCSICIKSCPFSKGVGAYEKIRKVFNRKKQSL
jgi:ferredoxin